MDSDMDEDESFSQEQDEQDESYSHNSLWPDDRQIQEGLDFDPFEMNLPGDTLAVKLRYLLGRGIIFDTEGGRCPGKNLQLMTLKSLYAAMIGFNKDNLTLLYPNGTMGSTLARLLLTTAQQVGDGPSVRDRCCGHVFEKGETYYRCKYAVILEMLIQAMLCGSYSCHLFDLFQYPRPPKSLCHNASR